MTKSTEDKCYKLLKKNIEQEVNIFGQLNQANEQLISLLETFSTHNDEEKQGIIIEHVKKILSVQQILQDSIEKVIPVMEGGDE